jgi:hypothetical protein
MGRFPLAIAGAICLATSLQASDAVTIRVIKYPELGQVVKQNKGHVIVVDFWADT